MDIQRIRLIIDSKKAADKSINKNLALKMLNILKYWIEKPRIIIFYKKLSNSLSFTFLKLDSFYSFF